MAGRSVKSDHDPLHDVGADPWKGWTNQHGHCRKVSARMSVPVTTAMASRPSPLMTVRGPTITFYCHDLAREFLGPIQCALLSAYSAPLLAVQSATGEGWRSKALNKAVKKAAATCELTAHEAVETSSPLFQAMLPTFAEEEGQVVDRPTEKKGQVVDRPTEKKGLEGNSDAIENLGGKIAEIMASQRRLTEEFACATAESLPKRGEG